MMQSKHFINVSNYGKHVLLAFRPIPHLPYILTSLTRGLKASGYISRALVPTLFWFGSGDGRYSGVRQTDGSEKSGCFSPFLPQMPPLGEKCIFNVLKNNLKYYTLQKYPWKMKANNILFKKLTEFITIRPA